MTADEWCGVIILGIITIVLVLFGLVTGLALFGWR